MLTFLVDDLYFTTQLQRALRPRTIAVQFSDLTIFPLLWMLWMSFFVRGSKKTQLSWDGPGVKQRCSSRCSWWSVASVPLNSSALSWVCPIWFGMDWLGELWANSGFVLCCSDVFCLLSFSPSNSLLSFCLSVYWTLSWHFRKLSRVILRPLSWIVNVEPIIAYV